MDENELQIKSYLQRIASTLLKMKKKVKKHWIYVILCFILFTLCKKEEKNTSPNIIHVKSEVGKYSVLNLSDFVDEQKR